MHFKFMLLARLLVAATAAALAVRFTQATYARYSARGVLTEFDYWMQPAMIYATGTPIEWTSNPDAGQPNTAFFDGDARERGDVIASCVGEYEAFTGLSYNSQTRFYGAALRTSVVVQKIIYSPSATGFQPEIGHSVAARRWTCSELPLYTRLGNSTQLVSPTYPDWFIGQDVNVSKPFITYQINSTGELSCPTSYVTGQWLFYPNAVVGATCNGSEAVPWMSDATDGNLLCGKAAVSVDLTFSSSGACVNTAQNYNGTTGYKLVATATIKSWFGVAQNAPATSTWSTFVVGNNVLTNNRHKCIIRVDMLPCTAQATNINYAPDWPYSVSYFKPIGLDLLKRSISPTSPIASSTYAAVDIDLMYLWRGNIFRRYGIMSSNVTDNLNDDNGEIGFWTRMTTTRYGSPSLRSQPQLAALHLPPYKVRLTDFDLVTVSFVPDNWWSVMGNRWVGSTEDTVYLFGLPRRSPHSINLIGNLGVPSCNQQQQDVFNGFTSCLSVDQSFNVGNQDYPIEPSVADACTLAKRSGIGYYRGESPCATGDTVNVCENQSFKIITHAWNTESGFSAVWGILNAYCHVRLEYVPCTASSGVPCSCSVLGAPSSICNATYGNWTTCIPTAAVDASAVDCNTQCSHSRTRPAQIKNFNGTACSCPEDTQYQSCSCVVCPIDCQVTDWVAISNCSSTCGVGNRTEQRTIVVQPNDIGTACPPLLRNVSCENHACDVACQTTDFVQSTACSPACVPKGSSQVQTATWTRNIVVPGANCTDLSQDRQCLPTVICADSDPALDYVFNRDCEDGEVPRYSVSEGRWSCFGACPVAQDPAVWAQFYPCRDFCISADKTASCPNSLFCYYEYSTRRNVTGYSTPVYVSPPSVVCRNWTRLCTASEMNQLCGKNIGYCLASVNGTMGASFSYNCSADISAYGSVSQYVSIQPCSIAQLQNSCYRDPSRCRVLTDTNFNQVQYFDCPWQNNTRMIDPVTSRTPPQWYESPLDGDCSTQETIAYCGSDWSSQMYRKLCSRKLSLYNEWAASHTFVYTGSCTLDVCSDYTSQLCPPGGLYSPLCLNSDVTGNCASIWTTTCPPCSLPKDLTREPSRRCSTSEMEVSPCARCRYLKSSGVIETDCGGSLMVPSDVGSYAPAAVGWNRQFITSTFYRECTREETIRLCGIGTVYSPEDPVWQWKRCGLIGNPVLGSFRPAANPGGCDPQTPLSPVMSSICYSNSSMSQTAICPNSTSSYNATINGAISSVRYYSFFSPKKIGYNGTLPLSISQCTDSQWQGARGCARFASECRVVNGYKNAANNGLQPQIEHKCWYTADDDWEWLSTVNSRYCETVERRYTCVGNTTDLSNCRVVIAPNGTSSVKFVRCPGTQFYTQDTRITTALPCTAAEAASYCPTQVAGWNLTLNPDSAVCNKVNCTFDSVTGAYSNCSFVVGSCVSRQCDLTEQTNLCGSFTHRCRVNCAVGSPLSQCVQQSDCAIPSSKPVRRCTSDEWMATCAPSQNDCRVQFDSVNMTTGYTKTWSCPARRVGGDVSYLGTNSYAVSRIGSWNDSVAQCGNKVVSNCTYSFCEFSWSAGKETCYCDLSTCNCPAAYSNGNSTQPCVQSYYFGSCQNTDVLMNQQELCGQFAFDCTANCTGPWYKPVCSSVSCSCPVNRYEWNGQKCGGMPVTCDKPVQDICGSDFASCKRVTGPSYAFAKLSVAVAGQYDYDVGYTQLPLSADYYICGCADGTESVSNRMYFPWQPRTKNGACITLGATNLTHDTCTNAEALVTCGAWNATCVKLNGVPNPETCDCADPSLFSVFVRPSTRRCFNKTGATWATVGCTATQYAQCTRPVSECLQNCTFSADGQTLSNCQVISSSCFSEINGTFACDFDTATRLCGQSFKTTVGMPSSSTGLYNYSDCHFTGSFQQGRGFYNIDMRSVFCNCVGGPFVNQTLHPFTVPNWKNDYGRCSSDSTVVRLCTALETRASCPAFSSSSTITTTALLNAASADIVRTVDRCLIYANSPSQAVVPWSCPLQSIVRKCNAKEVFRYCPDESILPNQYPSCMVECRIGGDGDKDCRLFGECSTIQTGVPCASVCVAATGPCTTATVIREQYAHGVSVIAIDGSCLYNCTNTTSGLTRTCTIDDSDLFDCDDDSHLGCTYEPINGTGTTVSCKVASLIDPDTPKQCACIPGLVGMVQPDFVVTPPTAVSVSQQSISVTRSYPPCAGPVRNCTTDEVQAFLGPGGLSCFLAYLTTAPGHERLFNYTCIPNWQPLVHPFVARGMATSVFQSGNSSYSKLPYLDKPCALNYSDSLSSATVGDLVAISACNPDNTSTISSASVRHFYDNQGQLASTALIPGTCRCTANPLVLMDSCANDTYYRQCTDTEYANLPFELRTMDCTVETTLWSPYLGEGDFSSTALVSESQSDAFPACPSSSYNVTGRYRVIQTTNGSVVCRRLMGDDCTQSVSVSASAINSTCYFGDILSPGVGAVQKPCFSRQLKYYRSQPRYDIAYFGDSVVCTSLDSELCAIDSAGREYYASFASSLQCYQGATPIPCPGRQAYAYRRTINSQTCETMQGWRCNSRLNSVSSPSSFIDNSLRRCYRWDSNGVQTEIDCVWRVATVTISSNAASVECDDMMSSQLCTVFWMNNAAWSVGLDASSKIICFRRTAGTGVITQKDCPLVIDAVSGFAKTDVTKSYPASAERYYAFQTSLGDMLCDNADIRSQSCHQFMTTTGAAVSYPWNYKVIGVFCYQASLNGPPTQIPCAFRYAVDPYDGSQRICYDYLDPVVCNHVPWFFTSDMLPPGHVAGTTYRMRTALSIDAWRVSPAIGNYAIPSEAGSVLPNRVIHPDYSTFVMAAHPTYGYIACGLDYVAPRWRYDLGLHNFCVKGFYFQQTASEFRYFAIVRISPLSGSSVPMTTPYAGWMKVSATRWRTAMFGTVPLFCDSAVGDVCLDPASLPISWPYSNLVQGVYTLSGGTSFSVNVLPLTAVVCWTQTGPYTAPTQISCGTSWNASFSHYSSADQTKHFAYSTASYRLMTIENVQILCDRNHTMGERCTRMLTTSGYRDLFITDATAVQCWQSKLDGPPTQIPCRMRMAVYQNWRSDWPTLNGSVSLTVGVLCDTLQGELCADARDVSPFIFDFNASSNLVFTGSPSVKPSKNAVGNYLISQASHVFYLTSSLTDGSIAVDPVPSNSLVRRAYYPQFGRWIHCETVDGPLSQYCSSESLPYTLYDAADVRCFYIVNGRNYTEMPCPSQSALYAVSGGQSCNTARTAVTTTSLVPSVKFTQDACFRKCSLMTGVCDGFKPHQCLDVFRKGSVCTAANTVTGCGPFTSVCRGTCEYVSSSPGSVMLQSCSSIDTCVCEGGPYRKYPGDLNLPCERDYVIQVYGDPKASTTNAVCVGFCGGDAVACGIRERRDRSTGATVTQLRSDWCLCKSPGVGVVGTFNGLTTYAGCGTTAVTDSCAVKKANCGPYTRYVQRICPDDSQSAADCVSYCSCFPGTTEFTPGVPCSGYIRQCSSVDEAVRMCVSDNAIGCSVICHKPDNVSTTLLGASETCRLKIDSCTYATKTATAGTIGGVASPLSSTSDFVPPSSAFCTQAEALVYCGPGALTCIKQQNGAGNSWEFKTDTCMCDYPNGGFSPSGRQWNFPASFDMGAQYKGLVTNDTISRAMQTMGFLTSLSVMASSSTTVDQVIGDLTPDQCQAAGGDGVVRLVEEIVYCACVSAVTQQVRWLGRQAHHVGYGCPQFDQNRPRPTTAAPDLWNDQDIADHCFDRTETRQYGITMPVNLTKGATPAPVEGFTNNMWFAADNAASVSGSSYDNDFSAFKPAIRKAPIKLGWQYGCWYTLALDLEYIFLANIDYCTTDVYICSVTKYENYYARQGEFQTETLNCEGQLNATHNGTAIGVRPTSVPRGFPLYGESIDPSTGALAKSLTFTVSPFNPFYVWKPHVLYEQIVPFDLETPSFISSATTTKFNTYTCPPGMKRTAYKTKDRWRSQICQMGWTNAEVDWAMPLNINAPYSMSIRQFLSPTDKLPVGVTGDDAIVEAASRYVWNEIFNPNITRQRVKMMKGVMEDSYGIWYRLRPSDTTRDAVYNDCFDDRTGKTYIDIVPNSADEPTNYYRQCAYNYTVGVQGEWAMTTVSLKSQNSTLTQTSSGNSTVNSLFCTCFWANGTIRWQGTTPHDAINFDCNLYQNDPSSSVQPLFPYQVDITDDYSIARGCHDYVYNRTHGTRVQSTIFWYRANYKMPYGVHDRLGIKSMHDFSYYPWEFYLSDSWTGAGSGTLDWPSHGGATLSNRMANAYVNELYADITWPEDNVDCSTNDAETGCRAFDTTQFNWNIYVNRDGGFKLGNWTRAWNTANGGQNVTYRDCVGPVGKGSDGRTLNGTVIGVIPIYPLVAVYDQYGKRVTTNTSSTRELFYSYDELNCPSGYSRVLVSFATRPPKAQGYVSWQNKWSTPLLTDDLPILDDGAPLTPWNPADCDVDAGTLPFAKWRHFCWAPEKSVAFNRARYSAIVNGTGPSTASDVRYAGPRLRSGAQYTVRPEMNDCTFTKTCNCMYGSKCTSTPYAFQWIEGYNDCYDDRKNRYYVNIFPSYTYACHIPGAPNRASVQSTMCDPALLKTIPTGDLPCEYNFSYAETGGSYMRLASTKNLTTGLLMNMCVKLAATVTPDDQACVKIDSSIPCANTTSCPTLAVGCRQRKLWVKKTLYPGSPDLSIAVTPSGTLSPNFAGSTSQTLTEFLCILDYTKPWFPDTNAVYSSFIDQYARRTLSLYRVNYLGLPTYAYFMNSRPDGTCNSFSVDPQFYRIASIGGVLWQLLPTDWCLGRGTLSQNSYGVFDVNGTCACIPGFRGSSCEYVDATLQSFTVLSTITGCDNAKVSSLGIPCGLQEDCNANAFWTNSSTGIRVQVKSVTNFMTRDTRAACGGHGVYNWHTGACDCDIGWNSTRYSIVCTTYLCGNGCKNNGSCTNSGCVCSDPNVWQGQFCDESVQAKCNSNAGCGYPDRGVCVTSASGSSSCSCNSVPGGYFSGPGCSTVNMNDTSLSASCRLNGGTLFYTGDPAIGIQCKCPPSRTGRSCEFSRCPLNPNTNAWSIGGKLSDCSGFGNATCTQVAPGDWRCINNPSGACEGSNAFMLVGGCACDIKKDSASTCLNPTDLPGSPLCSGKGVCSPIWDPVKQVDTYGCICNANTTGTYCESSVCDPPTGVALQIGLATTCSGDKCLGDTKMCSCNSAQKLYENNGVYYTRVGKFCQIQVTDQCIHMIRATNLICGGNGRCGCLGGTTDLVTGDCVNGTWGCSCNAGTSGTFCESKIGCIATDTTCGGPTKGSCDSPTANGMVCRCLNPSVWNKTSVNEPCTQPSCSMGGRVAARVTSDGLNCECIDPLMVWTSDAATSCKQSRCPVWPSTGEVCGRRYQFDPLVDPLCAIQNNGNSSRCNTKGVQCVSTSLTTGECSCALSSGYVKSSDGTRSMCIPQCTLNTTLQAVPVDQQPPFVCNCAPGFWGTSCEKKRCLDIGVYQPNDDSCACPKTFTGTNCEISRCALMGTTKMGVYDACVCPSNTTGQLCEISCNNGGIGSVYPANASCQCAKGWEGGNCELSVCMPNGKTLPNGSCQCTAPGNWNATELCAKCSEGYDISSGCIASVCQNGGTYDFTAHRCACPAQWNGNQICSACGPGWFGKNCQYNMCGAYGSTPRSAIDNGTAPVVNYGTPYTDGSGCACADSKHNGTFCNNCTYQWTNAPFCNVTTCENRGNVSATDPLSCVCPPRFSGRRCETYSNPCLWGGTMTDKFNPDANCTCPVFRTGQFCQTQVPCLWGGTWDWNQLTCLCWPPMWGVLCDHGSFPCYNGGWFNTSTGKCNCNNTANSTLTFYGDHCDFVNTSSVNPCQNGGIFSSLTQSCVCPQSTWWTGVNCSVWAPPCSTTGTASVLPSGNCSCRAYFSGELCSVLTSPCVNGGVFNTSTYMCDCPAGWNGTLCSVANNICSPPNGNFNYTTKTCDCTPPWTGSICQTNSFPCYFNSTFNRNNRMCDCPNNVTVVDGGNMTLAYTGGHCNESTVMSTICRNGAVYNQQTHRCVCSSHWTGDFCDTWVLPCENGGLQVPVNSTTARCECSNSSMWTGEFCQFPVFSCFNGGEYDQSSGNCSCTELWTGQACTVFVDPCSDGRSWVGTACPASGCTSSSQGQCMCPSGYGGPQCATKQPLPAAFKCQNGGTSDGYSCKCPEPFNGAFCETNKCTTVYKNSYLSCPRTSTTCTCQCLPGFGGTDCLLVTDAVLSKASVCKNGGVLNTTSNTCACPDPNYADDFCSTRICGDNGYIVTNFNIRSCVCNTGWSTDSSGRCVVQAKNCGPHGYTTKPSLPCVCTSPWVVSSDSNGCVLPCQNRGLYSATSDKCICISPYFGQLCQYSMSAAISATPARFTAPSNALGLTSSVSSFATTAMICEAGAAGCVSSPSAVVSQDIIQPASAQLTLDTASQTGCMNQFFDPRADPSTVNPGSIGCGPGGLASSSCYCQQVNAPLPPGPSVGPIASVTPIQPEPTSNTPSSPLLSTDWIVSIVFGTLSVILLSGAFVYHQKSKNARLRSGHVPLTTEEPR